MRNFRRSILALFLAFAFASPSLAAILWVGGEDMEFTATGSTLALDQTATHFRANFGRGDLKATDFNAPNMGFWVAQNIYNQTSFWVSVRVWFSALAVGSNSGVQDLLRLTDSTGVNRLTLSCGGSTATVCVTAGSVNGLQIQKVAAAGTRTVLAQVTNCTFSGAPAVPDKLDYQVISYGASGTVNVYINGALCGTFTGDLHTDSNAALNGISLGGPTGQGSTNSVGWSEIIIATQDTRTMGLVTMAPVLSGNTVTFTCTSGTAASVNAWNNSGDPQNCSSGTSAQIEQFTAGTITGNFSINALVTSTRSATAGTGPTNLEHSVRTGGADFFSSNLLQTTTLGNYQNVWATNPGGGNWTQAQLTAAGFNIGVKSQP